MTPLRLTRRWRRIALLAAGLSAGAAILLAAGPAVADPVGPTPAPTKAPATKPTPAPPGSMPQGSITWSVQPSSANGPDRRSTFTYTNLKPGTVVTDHVAVTNYSKMPVTFQIYATDAFETSTGSLGLLAAKDKPADVGSWVKFLKNSVTLAPSASAIEPFTLTVPASATPGDHTGGIIGAVRVSAPGAGGSQVIVDRRIAAPLYLRVLGPLHPALAVESVSTSGYHGTINPFDGGGSTVSYTIHNTGNVRLNTAQVVTLTGPFGITLATAHPKALTNLPPGQSLRITQHLSGVFPAGPLTVHVHLAPSQVVGMPSGAPPAIVSHTAGIWATPWPQLGMLIILVGLGFGVRWYLRWRRVRAHNVVADAVAQARRETAEKLSQTKAGSTKAETVGVGAGPGGGGREADPREKE